MIEIKNLHYTYDLETVLCDINLKIEKGDFLTIVGNNGSGKTTLIKCILGILKTKNHIFIEGADIFNIKDYTMFGYVAQQQAKQIDIPITGREYLKLSKKNIEEVTKLLELEKIIDQNINSLSGGQRQRIAIARCLLHNSKILIMDEPNTGLDFDARAMLYKNLKTLKEKDITIILVSHYASEIGCMVDYIYDIEKKEKIYVEMDECEYC